MKTDRGGFEPRSWKILAVRHGKCWRQPQLIGAVIVIVVADVFRSVRNLVASGFSVGAGRLDRVVLGAIIGMGECHDFTLDGRFILHYLQKCLALLTGIPRGKARDKQGFGDSAETRARQGRFRREPEEGVNRSEASK